MSYILKRAIKADKKSANKSPASRKGPKGTGSQKTKSYNRRKKGPMKK